MSGFDGKEALAAELRTALMGLLGVFPEHMAKPLERNDQFDAIVRAHKAQRLEIPVQALRATGGFEGIPARRFAWFVPSLLASWLDGAPGPADEPFGADDLVAITSGVAEDLEWTPEESAALDTFFEAALDAALATALRPPRAAISERALENGIRVWSLHSPSVPLQVLRVARALGADLDSLVVRWALSEGSLALDHLLEAVYDTTIASKHYLSHEAVADRLGAAFFDAVAERQARISKAEVTVRRNIARRAEIDEGF